MALPILAGLGYGLWSVLEPREERGALIALAIAACGVLLPIAARRLRRSTTWRRATSSRR